VTLDSRVNGSCQERVGGICLNERPTLHWQWLALASTFGFILLLGWASWQRWRLLRERRVALQMLTHEPVSYTHLTLPTNTGGCGS
ncbi:hypothetical protein ACFX56_26715, partial [Aeromonas hydrophila]